MTQDLLDIALRLAAAFLSGALIGAERSFHGRPAGSRTHALVCLGAAMLMLIPIYQASWLGIPVDNNFSTNASRMAQGIMTGIGFLGAGVIFKQGFFTVRGLTTAASMWFTAALGILYGVGFYYPAMLATAAALATLAILRIIEWRVPRQSFARLSLSFAKGHVMDEDELRHILSNLGFVVHQADYRLADAGASFEYKFVVSTFGETKMRELAGRLSARPDIVSFHLSPTAD
ncbi:MgtC/SapB family protein [Methyloceanibacter sp.]|uniref:MgtC/SapB family protein n=1 Tax=Methyloceanibacter sp. TaxID=1965321 RepID=UPI002D4DDF1D|nr:MgtC/SapB family protein [Methyloceanibacter sp.]HZP10347.1 MgtC/SapB family protein [Methyloceanibacter sp.]